MSDPAIRFFFPHDETHPSSALAFFGYLFDKLIEHNTIWCIGPSSAAACGLHHNGP